jgi:hypothetical protein
MSKMIEKVARAMLAELGHDARVSAFWLRAARRAIEAMREPTETMVDIGSTTDVPWEWEDAATGHVAEGPFALELSGPNKIDRAKEVAAALYSAMIDAALQEGEGK